jgi:uncharacterized protein
MGFKKDLRRGCRAAKHRIYPMKLQADRIEGQNAIARHGPDGVIVNGVEYRSSVLVSAGGDPVAWPVGDFAGLTAAHFEAIAALSPELVIFGSGAKIRFPHPSLTKSLISRRIGVETMDTAAACRTYNVLLAEGRAVVAALLFEAPQRL